MRKDARHLRFDLYAGPRFHVSDGMHLDRHRRFHRLRHRNRDAGHVRSSARRRGRGTLLAARERAGQPTDTDL